MKQSVRDIFIPWTTRYEGLVHWMYPDVKGLVSIGIGNLIDSIADAARLPFVKPDGSRASYQEIADEWALVKNFPNGARLGHKALEHVTRLRLTNDSVTKLVLGKLAEMENYLITKRFPDFEAWPADAQLATLSMAWACGPAFRFPKLAAALEEQDFETAALECKMQEEGNPGVVPRNKADKILYLNAARVVGLRFDPEALYWPRDLVKEMAAAHAATEAPPSPSSPSSPPLTPEEINAAYPDFAIVHPPVPLEGTYPIADDDDDDKS